MAKRSRPGAVQRARTLRQNPTPGERALWHALHNRQLGGYKFRRQHPVGRFIVDFCCAEHRLVVEVDGRSHGHRQQADHERTQLLEAKGYRVMRVLEREVQNDFAAVLQAILYACEELARPNASPEREGNEVP